MCNIIVRSPVGDDGPYAVREIKRTPTIARVRLIRKYIIILVRSLYTYLGAHPSRARINGRTPCTPAAAAA